MKKIVILLTGIAVMMTLVGCGSRSKDAKALKYMNKKYVKAFDDEFEIEDAEYADFLHGYDIFYVRSKKIPDNIIKVKCQNGKYTDNYIPLYYLKESESAVEQIVEPILGECTVVCQPSYNPSDEFDGSTTFEEFFHSDKNSLSSKVIIKDIDKFSDSNFDLIIEKIKQLNIPHNALHFVVLDEYKEFENYSEYDEYVEEVRYPFIASQYISLNKDYEVTRRDEGLSSKVKK